VIVPGHRTARAGGELQGSKYADSGTAIQGLIVRHSRFEGLH